MSSKRTTSKDNLRMAEKLTPEALANALAVASRLSATEMRELHSMLLKGGEEVVKKKKKKKVVKKTGGKKKVRRRKKAAAAAPKSKFTFQAWPVTTSSSGESSAPLSGRKLARVSNPANETNDEESGVSVKMSDLGLRNQGASVAVADSFAREAFGPGLDDVEEKKEDAGEQGTVPFPETLRAEENPATQKTGAGTRKRRKLKAKKKKRPAASGTLMKWNPSIAVEDKGNDQISNWSSAFGPMKYKLGKAKAAIQVYRTQIDEKDKEKGKVARRLSSEENEHDYTRMKLLAQEYLFVKCLEMCKKLELVGRAEGMGMPASDRAAYAALNAEDEVRAALRKTCIGGSVKDVVKSAEVVAVDIVGALEKTIASKQADVDAAKRSYDELNKRLEASARENQNLTNLLSQMTGATKDLEDRLEQEMNEKDAYFTEINGLKTQMERMAEENATLRKALGGQSKELEKYVDTLVESIRKRFGYVPPQLKLTAFFGAPSFAHLSKEFWKEP